MAFRSCWNWNRLFLRKNILKFNKLPIFAAHLTHFSKNYLNDERLYLSDMGVFILKLLSLIFSYLTNNCKIFV